MLGHQSPQGDFFRPDHALRGHVGEGSFYGLLAEQGRTWFRDEDFAALYREGFGRPSVPPSQLSVALLLQAHDSVSDEEAIARSAYDLRWKVALGLELDEKLCAKSTLQRFRAQLVLHEATGQIFDRGVEACRAAGLLKRTTLSAAIDTTPILGRGAVRDTYNLVSDGIRHVVDEACQLKGWAREEIVEAEGLSRHFAASFKGSLEVDWSDAGERRAVVGQLVADARVTLALATRALRGDAKDAAPTQALREAQRLLAQLLAQDIDEEPEDGGGPSIWRGTAKDRIVSTTDPEMRHGRKSQSKGFEGYKAAIVAETESGVILATDVRAGNVHDREGAAALVAEAAERSGQELEEVLGDTAYGDLETRESIEALGAEVVAKAPPGTRKGMFDRTDFRVDPRRGVAHCPAGKQSTRSKALPGNDPGWKYVFSRKDCRPCPLRAQCTKSRAAARVLQITEKTEALWRLRKQQKTKRFRRRYRKRVVVEHRIGRLVQLGVRQARYSGKAKTGFQIALAATVANLMLVAAASGAPPSAALLLVILVAIGSFAARWLTAQAAPLGMAPSRPGF
jgi:transposase/IS5 family transposase